ncbi:hypothetical protein [Burkholderia sp. AU38729]|uniref:hypothetical protein n=1 Tax=Burkholderia sp. AU38729 TaxID=2879633 RepID=UPI001CF426DB|nr:hypothetical protein [Burkholderia sp. AU38729]MCA8062335.1 hypothetical protein [Burkholderia sp. AU38729]
MGNQPEKEEFLLNKKQSSSNQKNAPQEKKTKITWSDKILISGLVITIAGWLFKINSTVGDNLVKSIFLISIVAALIYCWDNRERLNNDKPGFIVPLVLVVAALVGMLWHA